ncbi:hypothetical protein T06_1124 [Trichinella sp. T6]|nr:hypothetical protein T06_1124 [Trichinella sp. T6]
MSARRAPPDELSSFREEKLLRNNDIPNDKNLRKFRLRNNKVIIQIYPKDHAKSCSVDEHPEYKKRHFQYNMSTIEGYSDEASTSSTDCASGEFPVFCSV